MCVAYGCNIRPFFFSRFSLFFLSIVIFIIVVCSFFFLNFISHSLHIRTHIGEFSECSQKLMIWKLDENKRKKRDKRKNAKANSNIPKIVVTSNEKVAIPAVAAGGSGLPPPPPPPPSSTIDAGIKKSSRKKMYLYI